MHLLLNVAVVSLMLLVGGTAAHAADDTPPKIDWKDFDESTRDDNADHVVGEMLCDNQQVTARSVA